MNKNSMLNDISVEYRKTAGRLLLDRKYLKATSLGYFAGSKIDDVSYLFEKLELSRYKRFIDLGSGDGRVVLTASAYTKAEGIEIDDELLKLARKMRARIGSKHPLIKENSSFCKGNFLCDANLSLYDFIFINPDSHFYELEKKLKKEMRSDAVLAVYNPLFKPLNMKLKKSIGQGVSQVLVYDV